LFIVGIIGNILIHVFIEIRERLVECGLFRATRGICCRGRPQRISRLRESQDIRVIVLEFRWLSVLTFPSLARIVGSVNNSVATGRGKPSALNDLLCPATGPAAPASLVKYLKRFV
jgi:hypothetical protein